MMPKERVSAQSGPAHSMRFRPSQGGEDYSQPVRIPVQQAKTTPQDPATPAASSLHCSQQALAAAAHDLKTPLTILAGYLDLLMDEELGPLTAKQRAVLEDMHRSEQRLQRFIKNFLTYTQFGTAPLDLCLRNTDLNACISESIELWMPQFEKRRVALLFLPNRQVQPFAFDSEKVQHVVANLLDNALKFSPERGTVWVAVEPHKWERRSEKPRRHPGVDRREAPFTRANAVRIIVADSGPGIAPEFHQEIFDEFFRLPQHCRDQGTGLGLAIARRLVQLHGGKIWVESAPGSGSKFSVLLPLRKVA